ncbi:Uncharacterised protein [Mycobacteroides abscessus subsp. abscessus]|nr:Uncharacterised protein [Mycobacteroides abscessus subsp. abscessus]
MMREAETSWTDSSMARRIAVVMSTGLIPDRNTREKAPLTPLSTALSKRSKMLIVVLSSFPRAVCATYGVGGSEAAPSHSLAAARSGVAPSVGMFPMSRGLRVRIEGLSWQGIPCHDAPVTFGAHVTRVTISVLEQTECGRVVSHFCRWRLLLEPSKTTWVCPPDGGRTHMRLEGRWPVRPRRLRSPAPAS